MCALWIVLQLFFIVKEEKWEELKHSIGGRGYDDLLFSDIDLIKKEQYKFVYLH
jgi:hypothetical protein